MSKQLAFIGLGVMGAPMAGHLARSGHSVVVYNRTQAKADAWVERHGGRRVPTPADAAAAADVVFTCVGNDRDTHEVYAGPQGILSQVRAGAILVDHTTTSASIARQLAELAQARGAAFLDAPVSGGQSGAESGRLTVMVGGDEAALEVVRPYMSGYAKAINRLGPVGYGQLCKMANQLCIAGILQGLSEAVSLAHGAGLDLAQVVEVLKHGAAGSWQLENRAVTMSQGKFDFGFAIDWMRKDLAICFAEAERLGVELPLARQVDAAYAELQERGLGRCDTSVLIRQFDK